MKNEKQIAAAAAAFAERWQGKGYEKGETQRFWLDLLHNVFGEDDPTKTMQFEIPVKTITKEKGADFIDGYITPTKVLIEQKGSRIDLAAKAKQSDGFELTPYQQARRYAEGLPLSQKPRWIITCNFREFWVYDMEYPNNEPQKIALESLEKEYYRLQFLVDLKNENIKREEELSLKAGVLVGKLYDALIKEYIDPDDNSFRSLNILCVRIVFCLYAEDAGLFETKTSFEDYIKSFPVENLRDGIVKLFKALDTPLEQRDKYDTKLKPFPYMNGGLFRDEQIEIPNFTEEIVDVIVNHCAPFDWKDISPTIFGAVFESTLNPETRRKGGMHYTSIANIHKVIDPLFMDDLHAEFEAICETKSAKQRDEKLLVFQQKLGSLTFLDPACGSGNFLTETYLSLRRLENEVIRERYHGQSFLGFEETSPVKVSIHQFYGIEINDFAVTVATTALWIAESQMVAETEKIIQHDIDFLPLKSYANIKEGNALRMNWNTLEIETSVPYLFTKKLNVFKVEDIPEEVLPAPSKVEEPSVEYNKMYDELNVVTQEIESKTLPQKQSPKPVEYDYIIGNPPFVGYTFQSEEQKNDLASVDGKMGKNIDYVAGWYIKASQLVQGKETKCAFVSTNSITQGEQVAEIWKPIFNRYGIQFDFAYRTFRWDSESENKAHVHCVIIGFSNKASIQKDKFIFDENGNRHFVANINPYLLDAPTVFVEKRNVPLSKDAPIMLHGSLGGDDGAFYFSEEEYISIVKKTPDAAKFLREVANGQTYLHNEKRYCLWCANLNPIELKKIPELAQRVEMVKQFRLSSNRQATRKWAAYPYLFIENMQPESGKYLIIPLTSSQRRSYVPIGYLPCSVIANNSVRIIPNASLYDFGILNSAIFMSWMRSVCGRLKSDYRITVTNVYNNFPWPKSNEKMRIQIEHAAQGILNARGIFPDSPLADLYDDTFMPPVLRKAHRENDHAVMAAYGFKPDMEENEIVAELFKMYEGMVK